MWLNLLMDDHHFGYITKLTPKKKTTLLLLNCFQTTLQNNTIGVQDAQGTTVCTMCLEVKVQYSLECLRSVHIKNTHTHSLSLSLSLSRMWKGFWHMSLWIEFSLGECFPSGTIILCWRNKLAYCISFMNDQRFLFGRFCLLKPDDIMHPF